MLADWEIIAGAEMGMISPFEPNLVTQVLGRPVVSYGLSSHGYDMRCTDEVWITRVLNSEGKYETKPRVLDVKDSDLERDFRLLPTMTSTDGSRYVVIPPHQFVLTHSLETWAIPRDIQVVTYGKSTYARVGLVVNVTPMEAGWKGQLTIEISNTTPVPVKLYVKEGVAQAVFHKGEVCEISYADRKGKYQNTIAVVAAKV